MIIGASMKRLRHPISSFCLPQKLRPCDHSFQRTTMCTFLTYSLSVNNKSISLSNFKRRDLAFRGQDKLINGKHVDTMPVEIRKFSDNVWDKTLNEKNNLQFVIVYRGKAYLCNSYNFQNQKHETIGAICFIRNMDLLQDNPRLSVDRENMLDMPLPLPKDHLESLLENTHL